MLSRRRQQLNRTLRLESLQARQLLAADVGLDPLDSSVLQVEGSADADEIRVEETTVEQSTSYYFGGRYCNHSWKVPGIKASVADSSGKVLDEASFPARDIKEIRIDGDDGDDRIYNLTDIKSTVDGGRGDDFIMGGTNDDQLFGDSGDDMFFARGGDDLIKTGMGTDYASGGAGDDRIEGLGTEGDKLFGNRGNDFIRGSSGNDALYGGSGHDQIFGGLDRDYINGGRGNDGLFGGSGSDTLAGGSGHDRFLLPKSGETWWGRNQTSDDVLDEDSSDVRIWLEDGEDRDLQPSGNLHSFQGARWQAEEVEIIDEAFASLAQRTGNNSLLRWRFGIDMTFTRIGTGQDLSNPAQPTDSNILGWNTNLGEIVLTDGAFSSPERAQQTTFHEIAHNWDDENDNWEAWKAITDWIEVPGIVPAPGMGYTQSNDEQWWFDSGATFVRDYGKTNPMEDFATVFTAHLADYAGQTYEFGSYNASNLAPKFGFMDTFLATLGTA